MAFAYQKAVARKAWELFRHRSRDWGGQVMGFLFRTAILFGILFFVPWFGDVKSESRLAAAAVASVVFSVALNFIWDFVRAPQVIWTDLTTRLAALEHQLKPRFSVVPSVGQRAVYASPQHVSITAGGSIQTLRTRSEQFLCIEVTNSSASTLKRCEAYLSRFQRLGGEDSGWHALPLAWMQVGSDAPAVDIPPLGVRSITVFRVIGGQPLFITNQLPGDLVHYLQEKAEYQGLITLTADGAPATFIGFTLVCEPNQEPTITVMHGGIGDSDNFPWAMETQNA